MASTFEKTGKKRGSLFSHAPRYLVCGALLFGVSGCSAKALKELQDKNRSEKMENKGADAPGRHFEIPEIPPQTFDEDTTLTFPVEFKTSAHAKCDDERFSYQVVQSSTIIATDGLAFTGTWPLCSITLTPVSDANGTATVTIAFKDEEEIASREFMLTVNPVNDAPIDINLASNTVPENSEAGTVVGEITTIDADIDDTFSYSLVGGCSGSNSANSAFGVIDSNLVIAAGATFDYEIQSSYAVCLQTTDSAGASYEKSFTITLANTDDALPTLVNAGAATHTIDEDSTESNIALGSYTDVDTPQALLNYVVVTPPAKGTLGTVPNPVPASGTTNITYTPMLNQNGSDSFTYKVCDGAGDTAACSSNVTVSIAIIPVVDPVAGCNGGNDIIINGGIGNDTLIGCAGNDTINGLAGNDVLQGGAGNDTLDGGTGTDLLDLSDGTAGVTMISTAPFVYNSASYTALNLTAIGLGSDVYRYMEGVIGTNYADTIYGSNSTDTIYGGGGNDFLWGEAGHDTLIGGDGDDWLDGGTYNDTLLGGDGNDTLRAGAGLDILRGGNGNDLIQGNAGADPELSGGPGADRFYYEALNLGGTTEVITDFSHAEGDLLVFDAADLGRPVGSAPAVNIGAPVAGDTTSQFYYVRVGTTNDVYLYWDSNGASSGGSYAIARINGVWTTGLSSADFLLQ